MGRKAVKHSRSEITESVEYGDEVEAWRRRGGWDDGRARGEVVDKDGAGSWRAWKGPGKAECAKKSGDKGLTYLWSRNHAPRWQQQQMRKAHSLGHSHRRR